MKTDSVAQQLVIFNRKDQTAEDIYGRTQLDQDTIQHFPWLFYPVGELGWQWWAVHLLGKWEHLPQYLAAPPEYNETYYQLKGERRAAWLAALRRVCNGVYKGAILPDFDGDDDYYPLSINLREDYGGLKEDLFNAVRRGLKKLDEWLSWREQPAATQLLIALSVVYLDVQEGAVALPHTTQAIDNKYFKALLEELQQRLVAEPLTESWLRTLYSQLVTLGESALSDAPVSVGELPTAFPSIQWLNLSEAQVLPVSSGFWLDLKNTLATRVEWANKSAAIVGDALGLSILPAQSLDAPRAKAKLSYRQAAMFYYYTNQPLTENNKSELAARLGHTSESNGILLMRAYTDWCEQVTSELPDSRRQLGALKKDLAIVLPHLADKPYNEAFKILKRIAKKYERGL